ncbi:MAG: hypothetical protein ABS36_06585 [Acidobacteria bacterium SCN 69-37]|nr:MAG: hypothetical protein ABS36_06585 [Acidobacteria bacterium SCN 69-37]
MKAPSVILSLLLVTPVAAQQAEPSAAPPVAPVIPATATPIAVGSRVGEILSSYDSGGRRDPFASLVTAKRTGSGAEGARPRPAGLAGVALADVLVRGVVRNGDTMLAILEGPNRQSFVSHVNDQLLDATVSRIDANGVIFAERVERGVAPNHLRKSLRPSGEEVQ